MVALKIVNKNIKDLIPYEKNPRKNDKAVEYVANSISQFGFKVPIVIDKNNVIVAGHTRYKASQELGLTEVPCIVADDLNEEQINAFRLADNKVSEKASWDFKLLDEELDNILDFDMSDFGFDIFKEKKNERHRTDDAYNLSIVDIENSTDNFWEMPIIKNDNYIPTDLVGFNYAKSSKDKSKGIHFYLDDYQFERLWNKPEDYIDLLKQYDCILSPDFSLYMDMPMPMKIWNVYRSRQLGKFYQDHGIKVIPTISWAEDKTFDFAFEGVPKGSIVSISTIGVKSDKNALEVWKNGVDELIKRIEPSTILIYGGKVDYDYGDINIIYFDNKVTKKLKEAKK